MKNKNTMIICGVLVLVVVGSFFLSSLGTDKYFREITLDDYKNYSTSSSSNGEISVYYLGDSSCETCGEFLDTTKDFAQDNKVEISYLDTKDLSEEELKEVFTTEESLNTYTSDSPVIAFVKDGKIIDYVNANDSTYKVNDKFVANEFIANSLVQVTFSDYLAIIKSEGSHFMFIGSSSCGWCDKFKPVVNSVAESYKNLKVYYLDLKTLTQEELLSLYETDTYFTEEEWGTPLSLVYKNGKRADVLGGYVEEADLKAFLEENGLIK